MENTIHIGSIIKKKVEEKKLSIAEFAKKIYCDRTTVYDLFKRSNIDIERLIRISKVLEYNFIEEVYLSKEEIKSESQETEDPILYIAVPINSKELDKMILPENFILLHKEARNKK